MKNNANDYEINNGKKASGRSFEYKTKILGNTLDDNITLYKEDAVPVTYLSNFWRSLYILLIICKIKLERRK